MRHEVVRIVVLGGLGDPETEVAEAALSQLPACFVVERIQGPPAEWLKLAASADLCIVLESWPDEFPRVLAQSLVESCLTARLICCQGAWCASSGRTRGVWPQSVSVPVEQFAERLALELQSLAGLRAP